MPNLYLIPSGLVEILSILAISTAVFDLQYCVRWQNASYLRGYCYLQMKMISLGLVRLNAK
jgi:hypothetical protein